MGWETRIGLEVHIQLQTKSKMFSSASNEANSPPNTNVSVVDLGLPGTLPVVNYEAVMHALKFGIAVDAEICRRTIFSRKHYFYPDLPKGYQISQDSTPIVIGGTVPYSYEGQQYTHQLFRAHLEEDAGKSTHQPEQDRSLIDLNRAGVPLLEIVGTPTLTSAKHAIAYLKSLHALVRCLGICNGNMQQGNFRCDANVSVMPSRSKALGIRCEVKNLNSFKYIEKAINYEVERQINLIESGHRVKQQTRLFNVETGQTFKMRSKEDTEDYRYFPCPDIPPIVIEDEDIARVKPLIPELPWETKSRIMDQYNLSDYDAELMNDSRETAAFFEKCVSVCKNAKLAANWIAGDLLAYLNSNHKSIEESFISSKRLGQMIALIENGTISSKMGKDLFEIMLTDEKSPQELIKEHQMTQINDSDALHTIVAETLVEFPEQVAQYKGGKTKLLGFFVGKIMQKTKGQANPSELNKILAEQLAK